MPPHICDFKTSGRLLATVNTTCPAGSTEFRGAGINLFDLFWCGSTGMGVSAACTFNESASMLASYKRTGLRFFRFFATDWGPNAAFAIQHPHQNWAELDRVWDAIDASGLYAIPSIRAGEWHEVANAIHPGLHEGPNDLVRNATSISRTLALQYFSDFASRYKARKSLLLWELGNELNLELNLPPPHCDAVEQCFGTADMVAYTKDLVRALRAVDPSRPISSGFSTPRPSSWHMEHCPLSGACAADPSSKGFWATDTEAQFQASLAAQQAAVDVWSIHLYGGVQQRPPDKARCYFDEERCADGTEVLAVAEAAAAANGALLYVGEYGGQGPNFTGPLLADQAWPRAVLDAQVRSATAPGRGAWALSTLWAWECYTHRADMVCLWPNSTRPRENASDAMIEYVQRADARMRA